MGFPAPDWDLHLFRLLNQDLRAPFLDQLAPVLSSAKVLWAGIGLALAFLVRRLGRGQVVLFLLLAAGMGLSDFSAKLIKDATGRVRPEHAAAGAWHLEDEGWRRNPPDQVPDRERGSSFPSAHAANTACLAVLAMLLYPRTRPWLPLLPLLTGWSRIYLGRHYPLDVAGGWLLGALVAALVWLVWDRVLRRHLAPRGS